MSLVKLSPLPLVLYPTLDHPLVTVDEWTLRYDKTVGEKKHATSFAILQYKTSWKAILLVFPSKLKPVLQQIKLLEQVK